MKVKIKKEKFQERMAVKNISVVDLAERVKVGSSYLSQLISGNKFPSPRTRKRIASILEIKTNEWYQYFEVV